MIGLFSSARFSAPDRFSESDEAVWASAALMETPASTIAATALRPSQFGQATNFEFI